MGATQSSTEAAESPTSSSRGLGLGAVGDAVDRWFDVSTDYVCGPNSCSCLLDDGADGSFTVSQASITVVSADGRTDTFGPADEPPGAGVRRRVRRRRLRRGVPHAVLGEAARAAGPRSSASTRRRRSSTTPTNRPRRARRRRPRGGQEAAGGAQGGRAAAGKSGEAGRRARSRRDSDREAGRDAAESESQAARRRRRPRAAAAAAARRSPAATPKAGPKPAPEIEVNLVRVKRSLRKGIPFVKHCSDLRKRDRVLCLNRAETRVGWKRGQPETTMVSLRDIDAVRMASEVDPAASLLKPVAGTHILRQTADGPTIMKRAFSLVLVDRTLDIECGSELEARTLCAAFKVMVRDEKVKYGDIAG